MGFSIDMIECGQGDCFLITIDTMLDEKHVLIDSGPKGESQKVINTLKNYLGSKRTIEYGFASHTDDDHIGGFSEIIKAGFSFSNFYMNFSKQISQIFQSYALRFGAVQNLTYIARSITTATNLEGVLLSNGIRIQPIDCNHLGFNFSDVRIKPIGPDPELLLQFQLENILKNPDKMPEFPVWESIEENTETKRTSGSCSIANNSSIILELIYKDEPYALFPGDASAEVQLHAIKKDLYNPHKCYKFLKMSHHGSNTG